MNESSETFLNAKTPPQNINDENIERFTKNYLKKYEKIYGIFTAAVQSDKVSSGIKIPLAIRKADDYSDIKPRYPGSKGSTSPLQQRGTDTSSNPREAENSTKEVV